MKPKRNCLETVILGLFVILLTSCKTYNKFSNVNFTNELTFSVFAKDMDVYPTYKNEIAIYFSILDTIKLYHIDSLSIEVSAIGERNTILPLDSIYTYLPWGQLLYDTINEYVKRFQDLHYTERMLMPQKKPVGSIAQYGTHTFEYLFQVENIDNYSKYNIVLTAVISSENKKVYISKNIILKRKRKRSLGINFWTGC